MTEPKPKICVIIPTYNNAGTVVGVVTEVLAFGCHVIVIDDGSTDDTYRLLRQMSQITLIHYVKNKGKGYALKKGFLKAAEMGYSHAITIDSDGQHYPSDMPTLIKAINEHPDALIVGNRNLEIENMPGKNTFANRFSNFWFYMQTGQHLADTQCGYRAYPLKHLVGLNILSNRYEAELMLLVLSAWDGIKLFSVHVNVYYPPKGERVTHFRPIMDFVRISILNTILCIGAIVYGWPKKILGGSRE